MSAPRILVIGSEEPAGNLAREALASEYFDVRTMSGFFSEAQLATQIKDPGRPALVVEGSGQFRVQIRNLREFFLHIAGWKRLETEN